MVKIKDISRREARQEKIGYVFLTSVRFRHSERHSELFSVNENIFPDSKFLGLWTIFRFYKHSSFKKSTFFFYNFFYNFFDSTFFSTFFFKTKIVEFYNYFVEKRRSVLRVMKLYSFVRTVSSNYIYLSPSMYDWHTPYGAWVGVFGIIF